MFGKSFATMFDSSESKTQSNFESSIQVLAGVHTNETVSTFTLNWTGKTGLSAGQYSSDVTITICAN